MAREVENPYQQLPQVDEYLRSAAGRELLERHPRPLIVETIRTVLGEVRGEIRQGIAFGEGIILEQVHLRVLQKLEQREKRMLRPVINATGVILQTNLGRAPLSEEAIARMAEIARGYCNLEYDLESGERGRRGEYVEDLLLRVAECDATRRAALVVNNCAAANLLALNSLAEGGEVIVSRGELVEIGGGFRVPEILRKSGARLVEVGTTNRTRIADYAAAITPETRLILRVHRSNFAIVGFTEQPSLDELVALGARTGLPVLEDQGTGCLTNLSAYGVGSESNFTASVRSGVSLVCASGDKLLGGPQCGLVVGESALIEKLRVNPFYRAFRVDKLTYAALQATLTAYLSGQETTIPAIHMLSLSAESVQLRCQRWSDALEGGGLRTAVVPTSSVVGGGTTPGATVPSFGVALESTGMSADELATRLRCLDPPVIGRIHEGQVVLDLRTVPESADEAVLGTILKGLRTKNAAAAELLPSQA